MQIIIAGKAHPKDQPGKTFIREIVQLSRDPELWKHVVFVEDYDMKVAREMVQGVDLWLNTPRRGEEACGTSGMKAGINGVLNLSILDGWFDEAYEESRRLGHRRSRALLRRSGRPARQRHLLSARKRNRADVLRAPRTDAALNGSNASSNRCMHLSPQFDCRRMVREYMTQLYDPAHGQHLRAQAG